MSLKLRPLNDRVWIKPIEEETTTASGIVLPDSAKEKPMQGEVLAVGPGVRDEQGQRVGMDVSIGDKVLFAKYSGTEVKDNGHNYLIMRENDILAVVEG